MSRQPRDIPPSHALNIAVVCLVLALICFGLILSGCSGYPTAPSVTVTYVWEAAPGCDPVKPIPVPTGNPVVTVDIPGTLTTKREATVLGIKGSGSFTYQMVGVGPVLMVCSWK